MTGDTTSTNGGTTDMIDGISGITDEMSAGISVAIVTVTRIGTRSATGVAMASFGTHAIARAKSFARNV